MRIRTRIKRTLAALAGPILTLGLAVPAASAAPQGQYDDEQQRTRDQRNGEQAMPMQETPREARQRSKKKREVSGRVIETKTVEVRGADQENLVAMIETRKGNDRLVVDLGQADQIPELRPGDDIAVQGTVERIGQHQFLVADKVRIGGETTQIERTEKEQRLRRQHQQRRQQQRQQQPPR